MNDVDQLVVLKDVIFSARYQSILQIPMLELVGPDADEHYSNNISTTSCRKRSITWSDLIHHLLPCCLLLFNSILYNTILKLSDVTGSGKFKMAASELPKCISQLVHKIVHEISTAMPMF